MIGIDEVGRGCWAGPLLVVAARQRTILPVGVTDSKKLKAHQRQMLVKPITLACDIGEGWVTPAEIDRHGLAAAMRLGVARALHSLHAAPDEQIIMDGPVNYCDHIFTNVQCTIRADASHPIVGAASIYAKVMRDQHMQQVAIDYPGYGFDKHVGYGTKAHILALKQLGVSSVHRRSYKPVQAAA